MENKLTEEFQKFKDLIVDYLEIKVEIDEETLIDSIVVDSLDMFDLLKALEEEYDINIPNGHTFCTVGDLWEFINHEQ